MMKKNTPLNIRNQKLAATVMKNLEKRHFDAYYCASRGEAISKLLSLIPDTDTVAWGGSSTLDELGIIETLKEKGYHTIDRSIAKNAEEKLRIQRQAFSSDTFLMSSNAISEDGELVNIDGIGNRVAALIYGPRQVIILAGMNKVVKSLADAHIRARHTAAPINAQRFEGMKTPCALTGACGDCVNEDCICAQIVVTRTCRPPRRIKLILINEDLGF